MGNRKLNHRLVKIHRTYSVTEVVELYDLHPNTVRNWVKRDGLRTIDDQHPMLFDGPVLREFLKKRRTKNKQACKPGEIYCVGCHAPKIPVDNHVYCIPDTETLGNLQAICPDCDSIINRRINMTKVREVCGNLEVTFMEG